LQASSDGLLIPVTEIVQAVESGYFFMKIKIGQPGTQAEMLEKDKERLSSIHKAIGHYQTPHTSSGKCLITLMQTDAMRKGYSDEAYRSC